MEPVPQNAIQNGIQEVLALRNAMFANDLTALEEHARRLNVLLPELKCLLQQQSNDNCRNGNTLHTLCRNTLVILNKRAITIRALCSVYRIFCDPNQQVPGAR